MTPDLFRRTYPEAAAWLERYARDHLSRTLAMQLLTDRAHLREHAQFAAGIAAAEHAVAAISAAGRTEQFAHGLGAAGEAIHDLLQNSDDAFSLANDLDPQLDEGRGLLTDTGDMTINYMTAPTHQLSDFVACAWHNTPAEWAMVRATLEALEQGVTTKELREAARVAVE